MGGAPHNEGGTLLDWLEQGRTPEQALDLLREKYPEGIGQINIVDAKGRSVSTTSHTQARMWRGHRFGKNYASAGNILVGPQVVANVLITPHVTPQVPDRTGAALDILCENIRRYRANETLVNLLRPEDVYTKGQNE